MSEEASQHVWSDLAFASQKLKFAGHLNVQWLVLICRLVYLRWITHLFV